MLLGVYETPATSVGSRRHLLGVWGQRAAAARSRAPHGGAGKGFTRFPTLNAAGIRKIVNGPFTFTPDGNPLVGPVPGVPNYWAACGVMAGFCQGGGVGLALATWMMHGEPEGDVFALDVARFGEYATKAYSLDKAREFYSRRFRIAYPNEYWPAGRPAKTSALQTRLAARNAVHGVSYGLEYPLYFAPHGEKAEERPTPAPLERFRAVADRVPYARARDWRGAWTPASFSQLRVLRPRRGRTASTGCSRRGCPDRARAPHTDAGAERPSHGRLTTLRLAPERFLVFGSGYLQAWHLRWFARTCPQAAWPSAIFPSEWADSRSSVRARASCSRASPART